MSSIEKKSTIQETVYDGDGFKQSGDKLFGELLEKFDKKLDELVSIQASNNTELMKKMERVEKNVKSAVMSVNTKVKQIQEHMDKISVKENYSGFVRETAPSNDNRQLTEQSTKVQHVVDPGRDQAKIIVAGGMKGKLETLRSVECFDWRTKTWSKLGEMNVCRNSLSSAVHNNHIFVLGGLNGTAKFSMEKLHVSTLPKKLHEAWQKVDTILPSPLRTQQCAVYGGSLLLNDGDDESFITEMALSPPYARRTLTVMPERRLRHGLATFDDAIVIVGGRGKQTESALSKVTKYDLKKKMFEDLKPLTYAVYEMGMVKWGEDNLIIAGGEDSKGKPLSKVLLYNIRTQKSYALPDMIYKRRGCVAVVVEDTLVVMGGGDEERNAFKSVECFTFDSFSWSEMPNMSEERIWPTAVKIVSV